VDEAWSMETGINGNNGEDDNAYNNRSMNEQLINDALIMSV
jgi:hypothetical protein